MKITFQSFKVFPNKSKWYYKVCIFSRKESMYKARKFIEENDSISKIRGKYKFQAVCSSYSSRHKENKNQFGIIMFYLNSSKRGGTVSHEFAHATTYFFKTEQNNRDIFFDNKADEEYARMLGSMVAQYWKNWYKVVKIKKTIPKKDDRVFKNLPKIAK